MLKNLLLFVVCIAAFFLFIYKLTDVPPGINGDEAAVGMNAALISKSGYDTQNRFLPLFINTKNSPDWKQPVTVYATSLIFKLFGISYFNLRLTSVIFAILSAITIYFLIKELMNCKIALFGMIIFLTTPIVMIQTHLGIENIAPIPFVSLWLLMIAKYTNKQNNKLLFFAGVILGVSIFSYLGMRIIVPVLMLLTVFYIYYLKRWKDLKWFILGILPFILIIFLSKFYYPGAILGQYRFYKITDYQTLILPYISSFDLSFLFLKGDFTPYHSTGKQGMFLLASLPLFVLGIISIIRKAKPVLTISLISFFLLPLFFGIGSTVYRASRLLALIPFYIVIVSNGIQVISGIKGKLFRLTILTLIFILISLNFIDFVSDYWFQYPQRVKEDFAKPIHVTYQQLAVLSKNKNLTPYVEYYLFKKYPGEDNFLKLVYFPQGIQEWFREKRIPPKSIILTDLNNIPSKDKVDIVKAGELDYYFIINKNENEI